MPVLYSIPGIELYVMKPGLPNNYKGPIIKGSDQSYIIDNFGETVNQSVATGEVSINLQRKIWYDNTEMVCHHELLPGMFTRILLDEKQKENIRGIGTISLEMNQFYSLVGSNFTSKMGQEEASVNSNLSLWWSKDYLSDIVTNYPVLRKQMERIRDNLPEKLMAPPLTLTAEMKTIVDELFVYDYTGPQVKKFLHGRMKKLARLIIKESCELPVRTKSVHNNWEALTSAIQLIDENPLTHFKDTELGKKVGLSGSLLRTGIKKITGMALGEYCRYIMLAEAGRRFVSENQLVTDFSKEAGYTSYSNFSKEFKEIFWCNPIELRLKKKGLKFNPTYVMNIEDKFKYGSIIARFMSERETKEDLTALNKWLKLNENHEALFGQLLDDTKTEWTRQWFDAAGIKYNKIRWTKDGKWYRYDMSRDEQIEFYKWAVFFAIIIAFLTFLFSYSNPIAD